jgi:hypothetical protein
VAQILGLQQGACIPLEGIGGDPSYVSLLTCLQMDKWEKN